MGDEVGQFVAKCATPWKHKAMRVLMSERLTASIGRQPSPSAVCLLHAKTVLETGRANGMEGTSCWNHNVGNIRWTKGTKSNFTMLKGAWECKPDGSIYYPEDQRFRAFDTLSDGVDSLLSVLSKQANFKAAWAVLTSEFPTPEAYATAARAGGYFTAPLWHYLPPLVSIYKEFMSHA